MCDVAYYTRILGLVDEALSNNERCEDLIKLRTNLLALLEECEAQSIGGCLETSEDTLLPCPGFKCSVYFDDQLVCEPSFRHNAIVYKRENSQVQVLFVHPISEKMRTCEEFLNDRCQKSTEECWYCHGYPVNPDQLMEYKDSESVLPGKGCLALDRLTGLWAPADVQSIELNGNCLVRFRHINKTVELKLHELFVTDQISSTTFEVLDTNDTGLKDSSFSQTDNTFGAWEQHTKAIGSKLLLKMGYKVGSGLGKQLDGRVEPVMPRPIKAKITVDKALTEMQPQPKRRPDTGFDGINAVLAGVSSEQEQVLDEQEPSSINAQIVKLETQIKSLRRSALKVHHRDTRRELLRKQMSKLMEKRAKTQKELSKQNALQKLTRF